MQRKAVDKDAFEKGPPRVGRYLVIPRESKPPEGKEVATASASAEATSSLGTLELGDGTTIAIRQVVKGGLGVIDDSAWQTAAATPATTAPATTAPAATPAAVVPASATAPPPRTTLLRPGGQTSWWPVDLDQLPEALQAKIAVNKTRIRLANGYVWIFSEFKSHGEAAATKRWARAKSTTGEYAAEERTVNSELARLPTNLRAEVAPFAKLISLVISIEGGFSATSAGGSDSSSSLGIFQWAHANDSNVTTSSSLGKFFLGLKIRADAAERVDAKSRTDEHRLYIAAWKQVTDIGIGIEGSRVVRTVTALTPAGQAAGAAPAKPTTQKVPITSRALQGLLGGASGQMGRDSLRTYQLVAAVDWIREIGQLSVHPGVYAEKRIGNGFELKGDTQIELAIHRGGVSFKVSLDRPESYETVQGALGAAPKSLATAVQSGLNNPSILRLSLWNALVDHIDPSFDSVNPIDPKAPAPVRARAGERLTRLLEQLADLAIATHGETYKKKGTKSVTLGASDVAALGSTAAALRAKLARLMWPRAMDASIPAEPATDDKDRAKKLQARADAVERLRHDTAAAAMPSYGIGTGFRNYQVELVRDWTPPVQLRGESRSTPVDAGEVHRLAAEGMAGPATRLPYLSILEQAFGRHGVGLSTVAAHVGGAARGACEALSATAYARGDAVAFASAPDLHTAAHEVAHVVQQRVGLQVPGGVGVSGDVFERQADRVADAVVAGRSAEALFDRAGAGPGVRSPVQLKSLVADEDFHAAPRVGPYQVIPKVQGPRLSEKEKEVLRLAVANERYKNRYQGTQYNGLNFLTDLVAYMRRTYIERAPTAYEQLKADVQAAKLYTAPGYQVEKTIRTGGSQQDPEWNTIYVALVIPFLKQELPKLYAEVYASMNIDPGLKDVFDASREVLGTEYSQEKLAVPKDADGSPLPIERAPPIDCSGFIRRVYAQFDASIANTNNVSSEYIHFAARPHLYDFVKGPRYRPILSKTGGLIKVTGQVLVAKEPERVDSKGVSAGDIAITGYAPKFVLRDLTDAEKAGLPADLRGRADLAALSTDFQHITMMTGRVVKGEYEGIEASDSGSVVGFFTHGADDIRVLIRPRTKK